jgi:cold shock CspA family protein
MGKSQETFSKKEKETKKRQKRKDKQEKKEQRQANSVKGKKLEDMLAYIDENGNISATPADPKKIKPIKLEDIQNGVLIQTGEKPGVVRKGMVTFFNNDKGYGFIKDLQSQQSIFVHINETSFPIKERDKVNFEIEMGPKGPNAVRVKQVN